MTNKNLIEMLKNEPVMYSGRYEIRSFVTGVSIVSRDAFFGALFFEVLSNYPVYFTLDCDHCECLIHLKNEE